MSSNTLVVSNYSRGVEQMFGDLVVFADRDPQRLGSLDSAGINHMRQQALHKVLAEHTYTQRWRYMLDCIGFKTAAPDNSLTWCVLIDNEDEASLAVSRFEQQFGREAASRLLLLCSEAFAPDTLGALYQRFNRFGISVSAVHFARHYALQGRYMPVSTSQVLVARVSQLPDSNWLQLAAHHLVYLTEHFATPAGDAPPLQQDRVSADNALLMRSEQWQPWLQALLLQRQVAVFRL